MSDSFKELENVTPLIPGEMCRGQWVKLPHRNYNLAGKLGVTMRKV